MAQRALTPGNAAYCSDCGAGTLPDAAACGRCGQTFEGSIRAVLCPICNSINSEGATECVDCEARFPHPGSLEVPRLAEPPSTVWREDEFRMPTNRLHERERELEKREALLRDKARLLDERHHALSEAEVNLERRRRELQHRLSSGKPVGNVELATVTVKPPDLELTELKGRVVQLEEQMERVMEERNRLAQETKAARGRETGGGRRGPRIESDEPPQVRGGRRGGEQTRAQGSRGGRTDAPRGPAARDGEGRRGTGSPRTEGAAARGGVGGVRGPHERDGPAGEAAERPRRGARPRAIRDQVDVEER